MSSEHKGFVFAVVFILTFTAVLGSMPIGLQGTDTTPTNLIPVDPSILVDFGSGVNWTESSYVSGSYEYTLDGSWITTTDGSQLTIYKKTLILGVLWLGHTDPVNFVSTDGDDRGSGLALTEIETDSTDGTARYTMSLIYSGDDGGGFVTFYNTSTYDNATHAWDNDELHLMHGIGLSTTATNDIGALLVSLLTFTIPDVPLLLGIVIAAPLWASILFVLWYIITAMIPFVGGP